MSAIFPISLKIAGRRCVVIGGGEVAAQKVDSLLTCGGEVTVVGPTLCEALTRKKASSAVYHVAREYQRGDLEDAFIVIAATDNFEVNHAVHEEAQERGALINVVDVPALCDFFYPAVMRRGALTVSIATNGVAPALARALREQWEAEFDEGYLQMLELFGEVRDEVKAKFDDFADRQRAWQRIVGERKTILDLLRSGQRVAAREKVRACIS